MAVLLCVPRQCLITVKRRVKHLKDDNNYPVRLGKDVVRVSLSTMLLVVETNSKHLVVEFVFDLNILVLVVF